MFPSSLAPQGTKWSGAFSWAKLAFLPQETGGKTQSEQPKASGRPHEAPRGLNQPPPTRSNISHLSHTHSTAHITHSVHTTYILNIHIHNHITLCVCVRARAHPHGRQLFSWVQLSVFQPVWVGNHLPLPAANHSTVIIIIIIAIIPRASLMDRDISELTQLCLRTKTSAWNLLLAPKAVQAHQVYARF